GRIYSALGPQVLSGDPYPQATVMNDGWASFDQTANPPILYPQNSGQTNLAVRLNYFLGAGSGYTNFNNTLFNVPVSLGAPATLQISTNNTDWISLTSVTNSGSIVRWEYFGRPIQISFRVMPGLP